MTTLLRGCWFDEDGQDLTEYALLLAFVVIASAAIFTVSGNNIMGIWSRNNQILTNGNQVAGS